MAVRLRLVPKRSRPARPVLRGAISPTVLAIEQSLSPWIAPLLECLRPTCRSVFVLRETGWTGARIAAHLGVSTQRVYALHQEAIAAMVAATTRAADLAIAAQGLERHASDAEHSYDGRSRDGATRTQRLLELPIGSLGVGPRAQNALTRASITTIEQLVALTRDRVARLRGVGPRSFREIESALVEIGLRLADA